jgi:RNA polymerase sigma-70 factor (ECF subfamily)
LYNANMHSHGKQEIDIEAFYIRYGAMVWRRCRQLLGDEDEAYDTMQEVFVKLIRHKERIYGDYMSSLLYRIATNLCLNKLRTRRRRGPIESLETAVAVAGQDVRWNEINCRQLLEQILQREKEDVRQIAFMYYFDGLTMQKIAAVMAMSVTAVHKRLKKLRGRFKEAKND